MTKCRTNISNPCFAFLRPQKQVHKPRLCKATLVVHGGTSNCSKIFKKYLSRNKMSYSWLYCIKKTWKLAKQFTEYTVPYIMMQVRFSKSLVAWLESPVAAASTVPPSSCPRFHLRCFSCVHFPFPSSWQWGGRWFRGGRRGRGMKVISHLLVYSPNACRGQRQG